MINVSFYKNAQETITGFKVIGHANYDEYGKDIICSAVSALVINTINSIELLTNDKFTIKQDEKKGLILFKLVNIPISSKAILLMKSLEIGLYNIKEEYTKKYIQISYITS